MSDLALLLLVGCVSVAGTWAARAYALRRRLVDQPGERRSHAVATPRGGGAGPVAAILVGLALLASDSSSYAGASLAIGAVAVIGGWDDHRPLPVRWRLLVHLAAGVVLAAALGLRGDLLTAAIAIAAVAVLVNVWNFMDGINGIAATQAALVAIFAGLLVPLPMPAFVVAVACLGFVPFNFPKARIFLGDVGSGALGVALAFLLVDAYRGERVDAVRLLLPLSAFLVDAGLTLLRRMLRGERWWEAHVQHLYQALARRYGHVRVTAGYAAHTTAAGALALGLPDGRPGFIMTVVAGWYAAGIASWLYAQRRLDDRRDARRTYKDR
ncbi:MAG TPA: hypothetical protein VFE72_09895 [Lysobacter sp.]|nr:hypothetical protein [Lysobacter sp.]